MTVNKVIKYKVLCDRCSVTFTAPPSNRSLFDHHELQEWLERAAWGPFMGKNLYCSDCLIRLRSEKKS